MQPGDAFDLRNREGRHLRSVALDGLGESTTLEVEVGDPGLLQSGAAFAGLGTLCLLGGATVILIGFERDQRAERPHDHAEARTLYYVGGSMLALGVLFGMVIGYPLLEVARTDVYAEPGQRETPASGLHFDPAAGVFRF